MKSTFKTCVRDGLFLFIAFLFISCENFLKGGEVAQEIKDVIAYNNAPSSTLVLNAPEGTGRFLSGTEKSCKLGYTIDIQFTVNKNDYVFAGMEAVSKSNPATSRDEYVQFTDLSNDTEKENGTYKVRVKLLKLSDDLMIQPKCLLIPKATGAWPPNDNTSYPQDSSIKVSFNKAINLSDFANENGSIKNIIIQSGDEDLLDTTGGKIPKYKSPYLIDDDKTLVIPITKGECLIENQNETKIINIKLNLTGLKDAEEDENINFTQNDYSFSFKINSQKDSIKPQFTKLIIARTQEDLNDETNIFQDYNSEAPDVTNPNTFAYYATKVNFNNDSNQVAQNIHKHHVNKLWIDLAAEDADSGIAKIVINEKLIYTTKAVAENGDVYESIYNNESGSNSFSGCFEYTFTTPTDGVINLNISLYDYSGNVTDKNIDFVKDTVCNSNAIVNMSKEFCFTDDKGNAACKLIIKPAEIYLNTNYFVYDLNNNRIKETPYFDSEETEHPIRITKMQYGSSKSNLTTLSFENLEYEVVKYNADDESSKYKKYSLELTIDATKDLYIIVTTEDSIGNTLTNATSFPTSANIINWYEGTTRLGITDYPAWVMNTDTDRQCQFVYIYENTEGVKSSIIERNGTFSATGSIYSFDNVYLENIPDGIYYIYARPYIRNDNQNTSYILGSPAVFYKNVTNPNNNEITLTNDLIPSFSVTPDEHVLNSGKRHVSVQIAENANLNSNLKYYVQYKKSNEDEYRYKTSREFDFDVESAYCNYDFRLQICNKNGGSIYSEPQVLDLTYDNVAPKITEQGKLKTKCLSNKWYLTFNYDDAAGVGFETNEDDEIKVKYITSPVVLDTQTIDWKTNKNVKTAYMDNYYGLEFEYDGGNAKHVYLLLADTNENYCILHAQGPELSSNKASIEVQYDTGNYSVKRKGGSSYLTDFFLNDGKWILTAQVVNQTSFFDSYISETLYSSPSRFDLSFTENEKKSFIKILCDNYTSSIDGIYATSSCDAVYPLYFYPPYYETENFTCKLKSYLECENNEVAIFADKPCLVHTFYCTNNLGNTEDNLIDWLSYATEAKVVQEEESFTYKVPVNDIPAGKYYTTIIHFADGTMHMTSVKQNMQ